MRLSIIIISYSINEELRKMTQEAVNSAKSCSDTEKEIIIVESEDVKFEHVDKFISSKGLDLNYNHFLNLGIMEAKGEYIALCNNDLIFHKDWDKNIIRIMEENNILSACPLNSKPEESSNEFVKGYGMGQTGQIYGWCIVINKKVIEKIEKLDEAVEFWYSDNIYAEQLKKYGIEHALVKNSFVEHLKSKSHKYLIGDRRSRYIFDQKQIFVQYTKASNLSTENL